MKREPICFICSWNNSLLQFSMTNILYPSHNLNIIWPSCLKSLTSIFFFWDSSHAWLLTDHCCYRALAPVFLWTIMGKISHGHLRPPSVLGPLYAAITACKLSNRYEAQKIQRAKYNTQITKYGSTEYFRASTWPNPSLVHWVQPMHCIDCVHMRTNRMVKLIGI